MPPKSLHPHKDAQQRMKNLSKKRKKREFSRGSIVWRILRGILFIICLAFFLYQSVKFLQDYYQYPTTTKIFITYPDEFYFPAVTVCYENPVKRSKFCATYPELCEKPENITKFCNLEPQMCKDSSPNLLIPKLGYYGNNSSKEVRQAILEIYLNGNISKKFWQEWSWNVDNRKAYVKPAFVPSVFKMYSTCYSENLLINSTDKPKKIELGLKYRQKYSGESTEIDKSIRRYRLQVKRTDEMLLKFEPSFALSIHSPFVPVNPFLEGSILKLGFNYNIHISMGEEKLLPFPYETDCSNYEELWDKRNLHAPKSQEMCKELCLHDQFRLRKTMEPEFKILEYPLKLCFECQTSFEDREILERCWKDCKPSCRNLKYISTINEIQLENPKKTIYGPYYDNDEIVVELFLGNHQVIVESHVPLYDSGYLFSYIGGLMGCWLGISIWAFARIAENVFRKTFEWKEYIKTYFKDSSQRQRAIFLTHPNSVANIKIL